MCVDEPGADTPILRSRNDAIPSYRAMVRVDTPIAICGALVAAVTQCGAQLKAIEAAKEPVAPPSLDKQVKISLGALAQKQQRAQVCTQRALEAEAKLAELRKEADELRKKLATTLRVESSSSSSDDSSENSDASVCATPRGMVAQRGMVWNSAHAPSMLF